MSKYCPIVKHKVVYLDCLECEDRICEAKENTLEDNVNWKYEIGLEKPEILGSGSDFSNVVFANSEADAFTMVKEGRNYIRRNAIANGKKVSEWYDFSEKKWRRS